MTCFRSQDFPSSQLRYEKEVKKTQDASVSTNVVSEQMGETKHIMEVAPLEGTKDTNNETQSSLLLYSPEEEPTQNRLSQISAWLLAFAKPANMK